MGPDPDPVADADLVLLFLSVTFKMSTKNIFLKFFGLLLFEDTFTSFFKDKSHKKVTKHYESMFFLLFLLDDIRIRSRIQIRIRTSDSWIWMQIREAQKHMDPTDPDLQQCFVV
jgi:hypothetical protein